MRVVVTGGGTGGHIYPALAVALALKAEPDVASVLYIGKTDALESDLAREHGIAFEGIVFRGMPRQRSLLLPVHLARWSVELQQAVTVARETLETYWPDVVFGTGGYVSAPVLMAAAALDIPYVVHEPDALPGRVNRLMARRAAAVTVSFPEARARFRRGLFLFKVPKHCPIRVTGNPIRSTIGTLGKAEALAQLGLDWPLESRVLLVTGGSQGARSINRALCETLPTLLNERGWYVLHQTGAKLYDETLEALPESMRTHPHYKVAPYYPDIAPLLAVADLAIARSGSLSLSEFYAAGVPTILVPYPHAAADHQRQNARASVAAGASRMLEDAALNGASLLAALDDLASDGNADMQSEKIQAMRAASLALARPDATRGIVECIREAAGK